MATQKQIDANRRNAAKSHGPRSPEGKARSSMNALKSGVYAQAEIIAGENAADLQTLTDEYIARFRPTTPEERRLVDTLIRDDWRLRRLARAEAQLWEFSMRHTALLDKQYPLGHVLTTNDESFIRLQRRINQIERSSQNALRELERIQSQRDLEPGVREAAAPPPENAPAPDPQVQQTETTSPEIGFVRPVPKPEEFMNGMSLEEMLHCLSSEMSE